MISTLSLTTILIVIIILIHVLCNICIVCVYLRGKWTMGDSAMLRYCTTRCPLQMVCSFVMVSTSCSDYKEKKRKIKDMLKIKYQTQGHLFFGSELINYSFEDTL